jgi:dCTP deaminase
MTDLHATVLPGVLPDHEIRTLAQAGMIRPFRESSREPGRLSHGLQPYGYDVRLYPELLLLRQDIRYADPKRLGLHHYQRVRPRRDGTLIIPAGAFALARTIEEFRIPPDITALVLNKSTLARSGILVHTTVLEAGWTGTVTLEITNLNHVPAVLYAGEGVAQVVFFRGASRAERDYQELGGPYQGQRGITPPRVRGAYAPAGGRSPGRSGEKDEQIPF